MNPPTTSTHQAQGVIRCARLSVLQRTSCKLYCRRIFNKKNTFWQLRLVGDSNVKSVFSFCCSFIGNRAGVQIWANAKGFPKGIDGHPTKRIHCPKRIDVHATKRIQCPKKIDVHPTKSLQCPKRIGDQCCNRPKCFPSKERAGSVQFTARIGGLDLSKVPFQCNECSLAKKSFGIYACRKVRNATKVYCF